MRRHLLPVAVIVVIAAALFVPAIIHHEVFTFRDHTDYFQPLRYYTAEYLRACKLPLWNPYNASGEPWLANPQTGVFYPPTWLFIVLPFAAAYMSYVLLHVVLLGLSSYVLFARSATRGASLAGAVAMMLCGPVVSLFDVNNNLATFAWVPLAVWCGLERRPRLGGLVLALAFLGGEPFFAAIAAAMFVVVILSRGDGEGPVTMKGSFASLRMTMIAALVAFGLSAIQLFPFLELLRASDRRAGFAHEDIFRDSMHVAEWLRLAIPPRATDMLLAQHFIPVVYTGLLTVVLALIGLTVPHRAWPWLVLLGASIVVAAGDLLPTGELIARAPLTLFRYPSRVVPFGALAIVALAVLGLDRIPKRRAWVDVAIVLILVIDLVPRTVLLRIVGPLNVDRVPYPAFVGRDLKMIRIGAPAADRDPWIAGYLNLYTRRFDASTAAPVTSQSYMTALTHAITHVGISELNSMSVGWVISNRPLPIDNYRLAAEAGNVGAWRSLRVQPMARVIARDGTIEPVTSLSLDCSHARVSVDTHHGGIVVVTQRTAPGWHAFVDGREAQSIVFDRFFRAVQVGPGKHEIFWSFRPFSLIAGACVSALTAIALALRSFSVKR